jgi:hypothetical protein
MMWPLYRFLGSEMARSKHSRYPETQPARRLGAACGQHCRHAEKENDPSHRILQNSTSGQNMTVLS